MAALIVVALLLLIVSWRWENRLSRAQPVLETSAPNSELQKFVGRWQRDDGGYVITIRSVNPERVGKAGSDELGSMSREDASQLSGLSNVFIELSDENYPGSTYRLYYHSSSDELVGTYFQAARQQRYPVTFQRMK